MHQQPLLEPVLERDSGISDESCDSAGTLSTPTNRHAYLSATATLVLGIMGSAVLVISGAFAETGICAGFLMLGLVAVANCYTSDLLLRQCRMTATMDFDTLTFAVGGAPWRFVSRVGIVALMLGTLVGGAVQMAEAFAMGLLKVWDAPTWLVGGGGRGILISSVLGIVAPLCLFDNLTSLDLAGFAGFILVAFLVVWIVAQSAIRSLPAIPHDFAIGGFGSKGGLVDAISLLGFAFYIQPIMLPMLIEMPSGREGARILSRAVRTTIFGAAVPTYALIGFFGAAWFGEKTSFNILRNNLGNDWVQAFINISIALYLALSLAPLILPTRQVLDAWLPGRPDRRPLARKLLLVACILGFMLAISLAAPQSSGQVLVVTGATGCFIVSYLVPIAMHLALWFGWARCQRQVVPRHPFWGGVVASAEAAQLADEAARDPSQPRGFLGRPPPGTSKSLQPGGEYLVPEEQLYGSILPIPTDAHGSVRKALHIGPDGLTETLRPLDKMQYRKHYRHRTAEVAVELVVPIAVLTVGLVSSVAALATLG